MSGETHATVIIPTYGRPHSLAAVLNGLRAQDVSDFEVVVVCDGLADSAQRVLGSDGHGLQLRTAVQPNRGPAAARNQGLALARGPLVIFLDDDVVPGPGVVSAHLRAHQASPDLVAVGPLLPPSGWGSPWIRFEGRTLEDQYRQMEAGAWAMGPRQFFTGNASVRLEHLRRIGGFDETFRRAEDVELAYRLRDLGLSFRFLREATVEHRADRSFSAWLQVGRQYGATDVRIGRDGGRRDVLESMGREYHCRHPGTRAMVGLSLWVPGVARALEATAYPAVRLAVLAGRGDTAQRILGAAFNLAYWRGAAAELGRRGARALIRAHTYQAPDIGRPARADQTNARQRS